MFPSELTWPARPLYETDYVKAHSLDWEAGAGGIYYSKGDQFRWLDSTKELTDRAADPRCGGAEKKMTLSVISALKYMYTSGAPNYCNRTAADQQLIRTRQALGLKELASLEQMARSMPERSWVGGPAPVST